MARQDLEPLGRMELQTIFDNGQSHPVEKRQFVIIGPFRNPRYIELSCYEVGKQRHERWFVDHYLDDVKRAFENANRTGKPVTAKQKLMVDPNAPENILVLDGITPQHHFWLDREF